jgi:hypothetical protein
VTFDPAVNARYGRITISWFLAFHALLLIVVSAGSWYFAARANGHGIAPNTELGFRSQYTLSSLHGWYVAQRVGFHFVAIGTTAVAVVVFAAVAFAFVRRSNPMWMFFVPVIGNLAIAACFIIAGQHADQAAIAVENPAASGSVTHVPGLTRALPAGSEPNSPSGHAVTLTSLTHHLQRHHRSIVARDLN